MDSRGPEKKERLLAALDQGMVMVHLDARRPGVLVPAQLREEAHLRLNLSYRFEPPDLSVGDWGVRSTLSFGGSRFKVAIPWSALFAISSHASREYWMFPDDIPPELLQHAVPSERPGAPEPVPAPRPGLRLAPVPEAAGQPPAVEDAAPVTDARPAAEPKPALREVPREEESSEGEGPHEPPPKPSGRGHLRVVK